MGANIIPMVKKRGRTVLGVRIGLVNCERASHWNKAPELVHILPRLQSLLPKSRIWKPSSDKAPTRLAGPPIPSPPPPLNRPAQQQSGTPGTETH